MYYQKKEPGGSVYTAIYDSTNATTGLQSIFRLQPGVTTRVIIEQVRGSRTTSTNLSEYGLYYYRGSTTPLSTAYSATPTPISGVTGYPASVSSLNVGSTILPSTTSVVTILHDGSAASGYVFDGYGDMEIAPGQIFDLVGVNLGSSTVTEDVHITLRWRETGKNPIS